MAGLTGAEGFAGPGDVGGGVAFDAAGIPKVGVAGGEFLRGGGNLDMVSELAGAAALRFDDPA